MKLSLRTPLVSALCVFASLFIAACSSDMNTNTNTNATTNTAATPASPTPATQTLSTVERPQKIKDQMQQRGVQDEAAPVLRILEPREGATINGSTVNVRLDLGGDLKGYKPMKDPATGMGNHIHVILDNQPYEAYYNLGQPFELRNVTAGTHTLRVFASRPWHESYKNDGSFQMVTFNVRGGGDASKPTTTATGQTMSNNNANTTNAATPAANAATPANANAQASAAASPSASPAREGKEMQASQGGAVNKSQPLLTYSRPKGEYKDADADAIMIDFWLSNAKLEGDGGEYRVRYSVDGATPQHLSKWQPIWLSGWTAGKHTIKLELVDRNDSVVDNGGYNSTSREITVVK